MTINNAHISLYCEGGVNTNNTEPLKALEQSMEKGYSLLEEYDFQLACYASNPSYDRIKQWEKDLLDNLKKVIVNIGFFKIFWMKVGSFIRDDYGLASVGSTRHNENLIKTKLEILGEIYQRLIVYIKNNGINNDPKGVLATKQILNSNSKIIEYGNFEVQYIENRVSNIIYKGSKIHFEGKKMRQQDKLILVSLIEKKGDRLLNDHAIEIIEAYGIKQSNDEVDRSISRLRNFIKDHDKNVIVTVPGIGKYLVENN